MFSNSEVLKSQSWLDACHESVKSWQVGKDWILDMRREVLVNQGLLDGWNLGRSRWLDATQIKSQQFKSDWMLGKRSPDILGSIGYSAK